MGSSQYFFFFLLFDLFYLISTVLVKELVVKLDNAASPLRAGSQESGAEVKGVLLLAEAASGDDADTGGLKEAHAVELIGRAAFGLGGFGGLLGEGDGREEVHGALRLGALDALHLTKGLVQSGGALLETSKDAVVLLLVELIRGLTLLRRVHHELDEALADDGGAEHDGDELVDVGLDLGVESAELKVATSVTALANHALGDGVERSKLEAVELAGVLLLELTEDSLEAVELANEDICLVDLVGHNNEVLLVGELKDGTDVLLGQRGTGRVAGVDDDDASDVDTVGLGLFIGAADRLEVGAPVLGLVEVVGDGSGVDEREGGGVEGVLRDGDENTGVGSGADDMEESVHTGGGAGREVDFGGIGRVAIAACWRLVRRGSARKKENNSRSRNLATLSRIAGTPVLAL